jgi:hypothetical protein
VVLAQKVRLAVGLLVTAVETDQVVPAVAVQLLGMAAVQAHGKVLLIGLAAEAVVVLQLS